MIQCAHVLFLVKDSYTFLAKLALNKKMLTWTIWKMKEVNLINKEYLLGISFSIVVFWINLLVSTIQWPLHIMGCGCPVWVMRSLPHLTSDESHTKFRFRIFSFGLWVKLCPLAIRKNKTRAKSKLWGGWP